MDEDYDILPHNEIANLKKEIEALKKSPTSKDVQSSMEELLNGINKMTSIFNTAVEELKLEDKEQDFATKKLDPIALKLDQVIEQNKQIAEAIVAIVDMIKEQQKKEEPKPLPSSYPKPRPFQPFPEPQPYPQPEPFPGPLMAPAMSGPTFSTRPSPFHPPPMGFPGPELKSQPMPSMRPSAQSYNIPSPIPEAPNAPKKKGLFTFK